MKELMDRIVVDEKIRFGKLVFKGTRVPVDLIVGKLGGGMAHEEVMKEYDLTKEDILAAHAISNLDSCESKNWLER